MLFVRNGLLICLLLAFLACPVLANTYTTDDILSILNQLGGYSTLATTDGTFSRWSSKTIEAKRSDTVVTLTITVQHPRQEIASGTVCTEQVTSTEIVTFDTRDMQASVNISDSNLPDAHASPWVVALAAKNLQKVIKYETNYSLPTCPLPSKKAIAPERYSLDQYNVHMMSKDAAQKLQQMITDAWK
jgi:hypothetical protein